MVVGVVVAPPAAAAATEAAVAVPSAKPAPAPVGAWASPLLPVSPSPSASASSPSPRRTFAEVVVGVVVAPPAAAAATEAAVAVPSATPAPAPAPVAAWASPLLPVSPSLEVIVAAEHAVAVEMARDEAAFSEIRRQQKRDERFARLRNAELRGVDERLDAKGLQHQPHEPFLLPGLSEMRERVSRMQDTDADAVEAAASIYSPGKREFTDTPVKYIIRQNMVSVRDNGADAVKGWHEHYDSEPYYW